MLHLLRRLLFPTLFLYLAAGTIALAVEPGEILADAKLEARARAISAELRCLVCQNQSIDDSDASLARDLRLLVRERLTEGDTDEQIYDFVAARYGDFVLLNPPFNARTLLLWAGPAGVFIIGLFGVLVYFKRRGTDTTASVPLSTVEERRLNALMDKEAEN